VCSSLCVRPCFIPTQDTVYCGVYFMPLLHVVSISLYINSCVTMLRLLCNCVSLSNGRAYKSRVSRRHTSDINVLEILDSDHLPILFHVLDHVRTRDNSAPTEIHTHWKQF
jgi:hypothetical protein